MRQIIIVGTGVELLGHCINTILTHDDHEVIILDNTSTSPTNINGLHLDESIVDDLIPEFEKIKMLDDQLYIENFDFDKELVKEHILRKEVKVPIMVNVYRTKRNRRARDGLKHRGA